MTRFIYSLVPTTPEPSSVRSIKNKCLNPRCSNKARTPAWGEDFVMRDEVREYMYSHCKGCLVLILEGNLEPARY